MNGDSSTDSAAIRDAYTREYFLGDCGGHETYCQSGGKALDLRLSCMARLARVHPHPQRVLDLGCGRGEMARHFAARGCRVDAIDYSEAAIRLAEAALADAPELAARVSLRCQSVTDPDAFQGGYDLVLASDLIEHLAPGELDILYRRVARHLQPGGVFLVHTFPNHWYYRFGYPGRRRAAAREGKQLPAEPRSAYELQMHINEQSPPRLRRQLRHYFPHVRLWAGDHQDPAGSLARRFRIDDWRAAPSLFAVAACHPVADASLLHALRAPDEGTLEGDAGHPEPPRDPPPSQTERLYHRRYLGLPLRILRGLRQLPRLPAELRRLRGEQERLAASLDALHARLDTAASTPGAPRAQDRMGRWYQAFEDRFRGDPGEIRSRLEVYLPYIARAPVAAHHPVLDLGCGRGDWLALLAEWGYPACGVDPHPDAVAQARARGLDARVATFAAHLADLPERSVGVVSAFHLIEHLPFSETLLLLEAAWRVLVPGGLLVIETPNPENLAVGACHFHTDPTHQQPLLPDVMEHTVRHAGYTDVTVLRLNPVPARHWLAGDSELVARFNAMFNGPRDFAVVACKPSPPDA